MSSDSSESSDENFEGFGLEEVREAEERYVRILAEQGIGNDNQFSPLGSEISSDEDIPNIPEDGAGDNNNDNGWHANYDPHERGPPHLFMPDGRTGPTTIMDSNKEPLDFLKLLFSDDLVQYIIDETDRHAQHEISTRPAQNKMAWNKPTLPEMNAFLGLCLLMGINVKPSTKMHWSTDEFFVTPIFSKTMNRDRFLQIMRYLHFVNNDTAPLEGDQNYDILYKIRYVLNKLNDALRKEYVPKRHVAVDECMIPFKGKLKFKQYMPKKPTKWGIKCWVLANSENSYVSYIDIYTGRSNVRQTNLGSQVVKECLSGADILGKGYHVYMDNFFSSPGLFDELWNNHQTGACGTVRRNRRGLSKDIKDGVGVTDRGHSEFRQKGPVLATCWKDKKKVTALSTVHNDSEVEVQRLIRLENGQFAYTNVPCPKLVSDYTTYMGAVDTTDQYIQYYSLSHKTIKWYKRVFFKLLEIIKFCSYCLYKESPNHQPTPGKPQMTFLKFTELIIKGLVNGYTNPSKRGRPSVTPSENRLTERHLPATLEKPSWCYVCAARERKGNLDKKRQTKFGCRDCSKHLCMPECFTVYHSVKNYWQ